MERDHLPECPSPQIAQAGHAILSHASCICDELRACEQRSYNEAVDDMASATIRLENKRIRGEGYAAGVYAARDAVAALCNCGNLHGQHASFCVMPDDALAAIDALKGDTND